MAQASFPLSFWWDAFLTTTYLINDMPTSVLHGKSLNELLFKTKIDFHGLEVFGCACYPCLRPYQAHKL